MTVVGKYLPNGRVVALGAILLLVGCGSSRERKEGIQELQKLQAEVHGLHILVSAGVTKQEYSQRFEDVLLRVGELDQSEAAAVPKFPQKEKATVRTIYTHLSQSMAAYKKARDYFGTSFEGFGCEEGCNFFRESDYNTAKQDFPSLAQLSFGPDYTWYQDGSGNVVEHSYRRSDMLQALWKVGGTEDDQARQLMEQLGQK